jgi:hypothetical protein
MRRRFQFSLRWLLVVILAIACPLAWVGPNVNLVRQRTALIQRRNDANCAVSVVERLRTLPKMNKLSWLRIALGDRPHGFILCHDELDPSGRELLNAKALFPEATVLKGWRRVND